MIPSWVSDYIGIPFEDHGRSMSGADCWGLNRLVWREQFDLDVPSFLNEYTDTTDSDDISSAIEREKSLEWSQVQRDEERLGDGVLIRMRGVPMHVGLVVEPGVMLHIETGVNACIERYDGLKWSKRIVGFYRHERM